ncbi:MAG: hypothetical protein ACKVH8_03250 [Pirellulales bacterium]|jgi:hypothetical protein
MNAESSCFTQLEQLRNYVYETLCNQEQLEPGVFSMTERILLRSGDPCGIYFCLHGPRSVKYTAIWETETNTILFYGASGQRFLRTQLASAPAVQVAA